MKAGTIHTLNVVQNAEQGYWLQNNVFFPTHDGELILDPGQAVRVFLYLDKKEI